MAEDSALLTVAVDAMGADRGPGEVVAGVKLALNALKKGETHILLVGQQDVLVPLVKQHGLDSDNRVQILHASEVIGMDEKPSKSIKQKKDSSLIRAIESVKEGRCQAAVSCGNTGSLMAGGTIKLRPMAGVERPALASVWPSRDQHFVILDVGANPQTKPEHHVHNAILGSHYCRSVLGREKPRVALLSIGTEESKGHELIQQSNELLKALGGIINYIGPIEGFDVFDNKADVVLVDGFTGNVLLKTCESLFSVLKQMIKDEIMRSTVRKMGALMMKGAFADVKERLNPDKFAGAPLLGLKGNVLKSHGSSNAEAIASAIRAASIVVKHNITAASAEDIAKANEIIKLLRTPQVVASESSE